MAQRDQFIEAAERMTALRDASRLRILRLPQEHGQMLVSELQEYFSITPPALSHHLRVLQDAGLVEYRRVWRHRSYSLVPGEPNALMQQFAAAVCGPASQEDANAGRES